MAHLVQYVRKMGPAPPIALGPLVELPQGKPTDRQPVHTDSPSGASLARGGFLAHPQDFLLVLASCGTAESGIESR